MCLGVNLLLIAVTMFFNPYLLFYLHAGYLHQQHQCPIIPAQNQAGMSTVYVQRLSCVIRATNLCGCGIEVSFFVYLTSVSCAALVPSMPPPLNF